MISVFEIRGRAAKVAKMLAELPRAADECEVCAQARVLAGWGSMQRATWARYCGCPPPSETTWAALVVAARLRKIEVVDTEGEVQS